MQFANAVINIFLKFIQFRIIQDFVRHKCWEVYGVEFNDQRYEWTNLLEIRNLSKGNFWVLLLQIQYNLS